MSLSADDIMKLAGAGLNAEQMAIVARIVEKRDAVERARKEKQAERKRMQRSRDSHGTVTGQSRDSHEDTPPSPPFPSPTPPTHTPPISPPTTLLGARERELIEALGLHANERANGRFLALSEPINWLQSGCDMDADILPTVRALSAKARRITGWGYFSEAVFEARDKRLAPAPAVQARAASPPRKAHSANLEDAATEAMAEYERRKNQRLEGTVCQFPSVAG